MNDTIPVNLQAERDLIGAMVMSADARRHGLNHVLASDFYDQWNARVFSAISVLHDKGEGIDTTTILSVLSAERRDQGDNDSEGDDAGKLVKTIAEVPSFAHVADYARITVAKAMARRQLALLGKAINDLTAGLDPYKIAATVRDGLGELDFDYDPTTAEAQTIEELLAEVHAAGDTAWLIPGMVERDWRIVILAREGQGKSVLLRQVAIMAAQGVHPLYPAVRMPPIRTLVVDLENSGRTITDTARRVDEHLRRALGSAYVPDRCKFYRRPRGMELRNVTDRARLEREVMTHRPDLVCIGPAYRMFGRRSAKGGVESHEEAIEGVQGVLDDLRTRYGFAILIEHHAPTGSLDPYGGQRWLAWPDMGISLQRGKFEVSTRKLLVGRNRIDRVTNDWPDQIHPGDMYPWVGFWENGVGAMTTGKEF